MPLAGSPGPLTSISAKSLGLVFLDIRVWRAFSAIPLARDSFVECTVNIAFPFGAVPEPDGPDGGCPSSCEDPMSWLASWLGFPLMRTPVNCV